MRSMFSLYKACCCVDRSQTVFPWPAKLAMSKAVSGCHDQLVTQITRYLGTLAPTQYCKKPQLLSVVAWTAWQWSRWRENPVIPIMKLKSNASPQLKDPYRLSFSGQQDDLKVLACSKRLLKLRMTLWNPFIYLFFIFKLRSCFMKTKEGTVWQRFKKGKLSTALWPQQKSINTENAIWVQIFGNGTVCTE